MTDPAFPLPRPLPERPREAARQRKKAGEERWAHGLSFVWGGAILLAMLLAPQFGPLGILVMLGVIALGFFPVMLASPRDLAAGWPLLLYPALAVLSFSWSQHPDLSLRFALQLVITILAALVISLSRYPRNMVLGIASAQVIYFVSSIVNGRTATTGAGGAAVFTGLNQSKNYFADLTILSMIATLTIVWLGLSWRSRPGLLLAFVAALLVAFEIFAIRSAESAGATIAMMAPILVFLVMGFYRMAGKVGRAAMIIFGAASIAVAVPIAVIAGPQIYAETLRAFKKDPSTLTGRTYLWYRAETIMAEAPGLGVGYGAFWVQGDADAEGLWSYSMIRSRAGFSFHNTMIETRVNLGWVGYCLFMFACVTGAIALIRRALLTPCATTTFYLAILAYEFPRFGFEALGPGSFSATTVLMAAALSAGFTRHPDAMRWQKPPSAA